MRRRRLASLAVVTSLVVGGVAAALHAAPDDEGKGEVTSIDEADSKLVALSPSGHLALIGDSHEAFLIDVVDRKRTFTFEKDSSRFYQLAWSADGKHAVLLGRIAKGVPDSGSRGLTLWDLSGAPKPVSAKTDEDCYRWNFIAFPSAGDPNQLFVKKPKGVDVWDVSTWTRRAIAVDEGRKIDDDGFAVSPDGSLVALSLDEGNVLVLDAASGEEARLIETPSERIEQIAFSPDGKSILTVGLFPGAARLFDVASGKMRWEREKCAYAAFSPKGDRVLVAKAYQAVLVDARTGRDKTLSPHVGYRQRAAVLPDGKSAVLTGDKKTVLWELNPRPRPEPKPEPDPKTEPTPDPAAKPTEPTPSADPAVLLQGTPTKMLRAIPGRDELIVWRSKKWDDPGELLVVDPTNGAAPIVGRVALQARPGEIVVGPDGKLLALADQWDQKKNETTITLFSLPSLKRKARAQKVEGSIDDLVLLDGGKKLGSFYGSKLQIRSVRKLKSKPDEMSVSDSPIHALPMPNGKAIIFHTLKSIEVLDLRKGQVVASLATNPDRRSAGGTRWRPVFDISDDGKRLAIVTEGKLQLWDVAAAKKLAELEPPEGDSFMIPPFLDGTGSTAGVFARQKGFVIYRDGAAEPIAIVATERSSAEIEGGSFWGSMAALSRDGKTLYHVSGSEIRIRTLP